MKFQTVLFGGTFDPIHNAHIEIARAAFALFAPVKVLFVPAANPPHKSHGAYASYEDRVRMVELACAEEPGFEVSRIEQGAERSYSVVTIERLEAQGRGPLGFLIGADAFAEIETWHRWQDVVRSVEFIVVARPGAQYRNPPGAVVHELAGLSLPLSSSEIRRRLAKPDTEVGDESVSVPIAVFDYIRTHGLYQSRAL
ncbi:MAG: nicotinate (nicotinamide) nucleotide adenylyltransferase [Terriglobia bacterium]